MSSGAPPQFGLREPDVEYTERPCAYFAKRCDYFLVEIAAVGVPLEDDHDMRWVEPREALAGLGHASHRFGLETALR